MPAPIDPVEALQQRRARPLAANATPIAWVGFATACGACTSGFTSDWLPPLALATLGGALLFAWARLWQHRRPAWAAAMLLVSIACVAGGWSGICWNNFDANDLGLFAKRIAQPVAIEAVVLEPPKHYPAPGRSPYRAIPATERSVTPVRVVSLRDGQTWRPVSGRCDIAISGKRPNITRGDRLRIYGQLRAPMPALNPGQVDGAEMARADRRLASVWTDTPAAIEILQAGNQRSLLKRFDQLRESAANSLDRNLEEESAAVTRAMLLGDRGSISPEMLQDFRHTGTVHALVVSGLHVGLVSSLGLLLSATGLIPKRAGVALGVALAALYATLVGADPPALRATAMVAVGAVAIASGRTSLTINTLAFAGMVVFIISPGDWLSTGTQLSFLATATLLAFGWAWTVWNSREREPLGLLVEHTLPPWRRFSARVTSWLGLAAAATVAVLVVSGPLLAERFHVASFGAVVAAPVLAVALPVTLYAGALVSVLDGLLQPVHEGLAAFVVWPAAYACENACTGLLVVVSWLAQQPGAWTATAGVGEWRLMSWYAWLASAGIVAMYAPSLWPFCWRAGLSGIAIGCAPLLIPSSEDSMRVDFFAVGHGCSTLIQAPDGANLLVDAGSLGEPARASDTIARALWAQGVTRIDAVVLSHPDVDHFNALPGLADRFPIGAVWCSHRMFDQVTGPQDRSAPAQLKRLLDSKGIAVRLLQRGDRLRLGGGDARLEVLHPDDLGVLGSDNANSLVLGASYRGRRVLLPGDLESPGLDQLLATEPYDCDIVLAPHHGSPRSNPPGFARWCRPEHVVISSGEPADSAATDFRTYGAKVLNTFNQGAVSVRMSGEVTRVAAFREK